MFINGSNVTISVIITKSINTPYQDENQAIDFALSEFNITQDDWKSSDLEVIDFEYDYDESDDENDRENCL
jgi:hypothetical protein